MAKKAKPSKSNKKSRFGNPLKAAADAAARNPLKSPADMRMDRAMSSLAPGFALWLESRGWPTAAVDNSLMVLDDFFDLYRDAEPQVDPTSLAPNVVSDVMDAAAEVSRVGVMALGAGARDYLDYLAAASLWTGTPENFTAIHEELSRFTRPLPEGADGSPWALREVELPDVWIPETPRTEVVATVASSPLWQNAHALLDWIGTGRELTTDGTLVDPTGAAQALSHSGLGAMSAAAKFTTPQDHATLRLSLYWDLLDKNGLITVGGGRVGPTLQQGQLTDEDDMLLAARNLIGHYIFLCTLDGATDDLLSTEQVEMAGWLALCASNDPPASEPFIEALKSPGTAHPDTLSTAQNMAYWAEEGLVIVGEHVVVPPAWRPDVFDILRDDFSLRAVGPGAATV